MKLHEFNEDFKDLISIVAVQKNLPESAIERDYYIVMLLDNLAKSEYADKCVFKGGTSLSKCYPGSIERFSEDIDLTFLGMELEDKVCEKNIKKIENLMTIGAQTEKIAKERFVRSKSMYVWFGDKNKQVKLEIGSSVRPDPYSKKTLKSYIHEFLEEKEMFDDIERFALESVTLNVLNIERTFVDKLMSVKRHALCGGLVAKVRHIYDVVQLYKMEEIKTFLSNKDELKRIVELTKTTDMYYLEKRPQCKDYNPKCVYNFETWKHLMNEQIRAAYLDLHNDLLYTKQQQNFDKAINTFSEINKILLEIGE